MIIGLDLYDGAAPEDLVNLTTVECPTCGRMFEQKRSWSVFCNDKCRYRYHQEERKDALKEYRDMKKSRHIPNED